MPPPSIALRVDSKCEQKPDSKPSQIGFDVIQHPELPPRQCSMTLCARVIDEVDSDDTPSYSDRSNQEKQQPNMQGSVATTSKKSCDEEQNNADANDQVIKNVHVHGAKASNENSTQSLGVLREISEFWV